MGPSCQKVLPVFSRPDMSRVGKVAVYSHVVLGMRRMGVKESVLKEYRARLLSFV